MSVNSRAVALEELALIITNKHCMIDATPCFKKKMLYRCLIASHTTSITPADLTNSCAQVLRLGQVRVEANLH
jgi:hypothetical protein